jgi:hypothetical protein
MPLQSDKKAFFDYSSASFFENLCKKPCTFKIERTIALKAQLFSTHYIQKK